MEHPLIRYRHQSRHVRCEWDYEETVPALARRDECSIVVVCRSGNRSILAADLMQQLGFIDVASLKTGVRGWNNFDQRLVDSEGCTVVEDEAERRLVPHVRPEQRRPS
jgi:hypothetical protein